MNEMFIVFCMVKTSVNMKLSSEGVENVCQCLHDFFHREYCRHHQGLGSMNRTVSRMVYCAAMLCTFLLITSFSPGDGKRYLPNESFGFGERLEFRVGYKFITAGTAYFHVLPEPVIRNGQQCYDVRFQVRSLQSLEWLYRVKDDYRTVLDVDGIFPYEFEQHIREGGYKRDFKATFDQVQNVARTTEGEFPVTPFIHDVVSAFYYVRTLDLQNKKKGEIIPLKNFFDRQTHDLGVKILGKQTIEVEAGTFRCIVIEPLVVEGGLFKADGKILIWVSDDERKIPVKVATKIPIGSIDTELTSYKGLRGPLQSLVQ